MDTVSSLTFPPSFLIIEQMKLGLNLKKRMTILVFPQVHCLDFCSVSAPQIPLIS